MKDSTEIAFRIISNAGSARSYIFSALEKANEGDFIAAEENIKEADGLLVIAHKIQFEIISSESAGDSHLEMTFILAHAQDHLMTSLLAKELAVEIIKNKQEINELRGRN